MSIAINPCPTSYADVNEVLNDLTHGVLEILGDCLHAACLQGSLAIGGFDQDSDVDFLIVTNGAIDHNRVSSLQTLHGRIYDGPSVWATHLEGSYIPRDVLRSAARAGGEHWYLDHGARSLMRSAHCDTIVVRSTVREHGVLLAGPHPRSLVDPIPVEVLRHEVLTTMTEWIDPHRRDAAHLITSLWYQSFVVVSYCRMLHTLDTGRLWTKEAGVRWALASLDTRWTALIERAWSERPDPAAKSRLPPNPGEVAATIAFVDYALDLARREEATRVSRSR